MRQILITSILVILSITSTSQVKNKYTDFTKPAISDEILTSDSLLNKFMLYWIGKPYKLGGNSERGIDCSQFNKRLYKDVYNKVLGEVAYKQWEQTQRLKKDSLVVGDLIFFRSKASPSGWHTGTYIGNSYFIHAANRYEGIKISSLDEPRYKETIRGYGRLISISKTIIGIYNNKKI
jgi:cell wall-associated NlpC family hydrolase